MSSFNVSSLLAGIKKENEPFKDDLSGSKKILFVCTGNIARSASAEYIARKMLPEGSEWIFDSAGTGAVVGAPVARHINAELAARNIPYEDHKAKQLTEQLMAESVLVLVMEKEHLSWIVREWPQYHAKVHLLKEMARLRSQAGRRADPISYMLQKDSVHLPEDAIADPFGKGRQAAQEAVLEVEEALFEVVSWLG